MRRKSLNYYYKTEGCCNDRRERLEDYRPNEIPNARPIEKGSIPQAKPHGRCALAHRPAQLVDKVSEKKKVHKKIWFLIGFGTGIFMRRWALPGGRGSARRIFLRGS